MWLNNCTGLNDGNMKKVLILSLLILAGMFGKAQTFDEWFDQKKTQKKYLIQQIAAFKVYLGYVQKGYAIAQKGLAAIIESKKGDFGLHNGFFQSLEDVNPKISKYAKVADIIALQFKTMQVYRDVSKQVRLNKLFSSGEMNFINGVFEKLLDDCSDINSDLTIVITSGKLEMKDDERLKRIDYLYSNMQDAYTFAQGLGTETKLLSLQRMKEENDIHTSRSINGIKSK
jgi:hypothetical protein